MSVCVFCFRDETNTTPFCSDNPGKGCSYGFAHERPESEKPKQAVVKVDKQRCTRCGLHTKNPTSQTNGCVHEYATN